MASPSSHVLEIYEFPHTFVSEDVMAPAHPGKMKSEGARQRADLTEAKIRRGRKRSLEQFARVHVAPFTLTKRVGQSYFVGPRYLGVIRKAAELETRLCASW
jgi:hypothetical protein